MTLSVENFEGIVTLDIKGYSSRRSLIWFEDSNENDVVQAVQF